jgi:PII-like signaling protein
VLTSVLLRGVEGFGRAQHRSSDVLLTLSEDLPAVSVAVDTRERIEALLPEMLSLERHGLLTLERARLLTGAADAAGSLPPELNEATKLTVYVGRQDRAAGRPAFVAVCELLHRAGLAGATVLLGVDGTRDGLRARARFFGRNAEVPLMIVSVGSGERIAGVLAELRETLPRPTLTLERVRVCKRDGELIAVPHELPGVDAHGLPLFQKLMIHSSEDARHDGHPLHRTLVRRLRGAGVVGATSLRGIWGFHGDHQPHGDRLFQLRRHVPVLTVAIDTPERIAAAFGAVDEVTSESGLVTSEMVPAAAALEPDDKPAVRLARHRF